MPFTPNPDASRIVVPGVDPSLPPAVQIEQIDQLITLRLASIDTNLATAHQILTTEILPAVQRFARESQPTRDAARFWKSFFELAAQVRVPTEGDYTATETETELETETETESHADTVDTHDHEEDHTTTSTTTSLPIPRKSQNPFLPPAGEEHSFANVVSSTPARQPGDVSQMSSISSDPSWTPSHGSIVRGGGTDPQFSTMNDTIQSIPSIPQSQTTKLPPFLVDISTTASEQSFRPPESPSDTDSSVADVRLHPKGKGKAAEKDLRQKVLKKRVSKGGRPSLSQYNPFKGGGNKWDGIVDLSSSPSLSSNSLIPNLANLDFSTSSESGAHQRLLPSFSYSDSNNSNSNTEKGKTKQQTNLSSSSSILFPPPNPDLLRIAATPSKKAADLVVQDLLAGLDFDDSPAQPSVPTPRINRGGPRPSVIKALQQNPLLRDDDADEDYDEDDSYEDSYGQLAGTSGRISLGFGSQSQPRGMMDDSMDGGAEDDSFDESFEDNDASNQQQEGMGETTDFGAGFQNNDVEEDTLFGPRGNPPPPQHGFHLDGNSMHTYMHGGRLEDAMPVQASPTPFAGDYVPLDRMRRS